jgi:ABC-type dipeptide/oligopeptide/nickel transport system ATPase component
MGQIMSQILEIKDLSVSYLMPEKVVKAVEAVSLSMARGTVLGVVGESGCGKTSLALSIARLLPANARIISGEIIYDGRQVLSLNQRQLRHIRGRQIGYIFQDPVASLNPVMSIGQQLIETVQMVSGFSVSRAKEEACRLLSLVRIPDSQKHLKFYAHQLSGGMNQRVMIALALSCQPRLLIADEPTSNLDVTIEASIVQLLLDLKKELDLSIMFISHDVSLVRFLADYIAVMLAGKIVEFAPTQRIFCAPQAAYTKELLHASQAVTI